MWVSMGKAGAAWVSLGTGSRASVSLGVDSAAVAEMELKMALAWAASVALTDTVEQDRISLETSTDEVWSTSEYQWLRKWKVMEKVYQLEPKSIKSGPTSGPRGSGWEWGGLVGEGAEASWDWPLGPPGPLAGSESGLSPEPEPKPVLEPEPALEPAPDPGPGKVLVPSGQVSEPRA